MMPRPFARLIFSLLALAWLALAADPIADRKLQNIQVSHTETFTLPAGGAVRLPRSFGELNIEGWNRPQVEITVVKTTKDFYPPEDKAAMAILDRVHVSAEIKDKDLLVTTGNPHRTFPPKFPWDEASIDLEYRIKVPMDAPLFVEHGLGEVHFYNITGDVHASVDNGGITLDLPSDSRYNVQARSDWGSVESDFGGKLHRRFWMTGHQFRARTEGATHQLVLQAGYGDILIFKTWKTDSTH